MQNRNDPEEQRKTKQNKGKGRKGKSEQERRIEKMAGNYKKKEEKGVVGF